MTASCLPERRCPRFPAVPPTPTIPLNTARPNPSHDESSKRSPIRRGALAALCLICAGLAAPATAPADEQGTVTLVSTTSTENSGLLDQLLPAFTAETGIRVRLIAAGTGQALRIGRSGDADVLIVHHEASELAFIDAGFGTERRSIMENDFVIVGPAEDPAQIRGAAAAAPAMARIAAAGLPFVSRGDESGTHFRELELWALTGLDPAAGRSDWYRETGSGQGATLNIASAMSAYALTDRATWLNFANKGPLVIMVQGDPQLRNPYAAMLVNPARHPHVNAAGGRALIDWLASSKGRSYINGYRIDGQQAFFAAAPTTAEAESVREQRGAQP